MTPSFQRVPLRDIGLDDDTFCITYRPDLRLLQQSVARMGVLSPVQLRRVADAGHLQIVCGFKRLQACLQAGHPDVPALVYEAAELSESQAFLLSVYDNLGCRTLNVVEKGRILQRLRDVFHYEETELVQEWCRRLDLPPRVETLTAYCTLVTLEDVLQAAAVEGALPLETTLWIGRHATADRQALLALFTGLKLGSNRARELTALIDDLCLRDQCPAATVLQRLDVLAILAEAQLSGPQKTERVRRVLHEARYPLLSAHEQRFRDALRRLRLPSQISLRPPPYFEGQQVQVTFGFRSRQELQQLTQRLLEAAADTALDDLVALL